MSNNYVGISTSVASDTTSYQNNAALWRTEASIRLGKPEPGSSILVVGPESAEIANALELQNMDYKVDFSEGDFSAKTKKNKASDKASEDSRQTAKSLDLIICLYLPSLPDFLESVENFYSRLRAGGKFVLLAPCTKFSANDKQIYEFFSECRFVNITSQRGSRYGGTASTLGRSELYETLPFFKSWSRSIALVAQKPSAKSTELKSIPTPQSMDRSVSIVVPCHNEEQNVQSMVDGLLARYEAAIHEIVLVDDNSKDATAKILKKLAAKDERIKPVFRTPPNGVGRAISEGVKATTGEYVLSLDCDFQHILPEIKGMFEAMADGYDLAVGSRFTPLSILRNYPYQKLLANRCFSALSRILFKKKFHDVTNNCKMMRGELYRNLAVVRTEFAVNAETGLLPIMMGLQHREIPVSWLGRSYNMGQSSFRVWQVGSGYIGVLVDILRAKHFEKGPYHEFFNRFDDMAIKSIRKSES